MRISPTSPGHARPTGTTPKFKLITGERLSDNEFKCFIAIFKTMKIKDVMKKNLVSIDGERKIIEACKLMGEKRIGSVLVKLENKPYGIFTERDLLSKVIAKGLDIKKAKVKDYSSHPLITVSGDYDVRECARIMADMKIRRLLITSQGKIEGIFTASDLARVLSKSPLEF